MQGLAWLVRMYAEGTCSDYRFTYEHHSPTVGLLRAALQAQALCDGLLQTAQGSASTSAASWDPGRALWRPLATWSLDRSAARRQGALRRRGRRRRVGKG